MSFLLDFHSNGSPFSPLPARLDTLLPASIFILAFVFDILSSIHYPNVLRLPWRLLSSPFQNFLALNDLLEPVDCAVSVDRTKTRHLAGLSTLAFIGWLGCLIYGVYMRDKEYTLKSLVLSVSWGYIALKISMKPPLTPPYLLITLAITSVLTSCVAFGTDISMFDGTKLAILDILAVVVPTAFAYTAGTLPLKTYRPSLNVAKPNDVPSSMLTCPEDNVNLWTWVTFAFVQPILDLAVKRTLNENDVWSLSPFFSHENLFHKYQEYQEIHPSHTLLRFLFASNSLDLTLDVVLEMWSAIFGFVSPFALQKILAALTVNTPESKSQASIWTLVTFIANLSFGQVNVFQNWYTRRCYERTRGQLFCTLHYKSLKRKDISGKVHREGQENDADLGKILNLMERDTYAVAQHFWEFSGLCTAPVRIAISLTFLYQILGWSALSGVVVVIVAFILDYPLLQYTFYLSRSSAKANDVRMRTVNELIQNIRFLKFYGWEYEWSRKAEKDREAELKWRIRRNFAETATNFIWVWMPSATVLISFLCYTLLSKEKLTVSKAFTSISLFFQLQTPMVSLPNQVKAMLDAYVSLQRIEDFLKEGEVPEWASSLSSNKNGNNDNREIGFSNAAFEWEESFNNNNNNNNNNNTPSSKFRLGPLDFVLPSGRLTIVSGPTGSGKSAMLVALLGEMHCTSGRVLVDKSNHQVAYCAQNPWLELATIRDNITFGSSAPFDETRYQSVLDSCALGQDLHILDAGDLTEIGEKGVTLSGGQRARVALARAMYSQAKVNLTQLRLNYTLTEHILAKVILLDDPLSAVDMHTAQHIVSNCLSGELARDRTIILVTHHITLCLPVASYLVKVNKGEILHHGPVPELHDRDLLLKVIEMEEELFSQPKSPISAVMDSSQNLGSRLCRQPIDGKLVEKEARAEGHVSYRSYRAYFRASGISSCVATVTVALLIRVINIGNQVYLACWGEAYNAEDPALATTLSQFMKLRIGYPWLNLPSPNEDIKPWLMIYLYISITGALTVLLYIVIGYYASLQASRTLFIALLRRVTRAPARFFDVTPVGRILNRFTTDIVTVDNALQGSARSCLSGVLNFLASFGFIVFMIPHFIPFAFFIAWLYVRLAPSYIQASRDLRRLESISRSPVFAGYDELLRGITHIRAFAMERRYQDNFYARVDKFQSFDHTYWLVNGWLMWRYDCLGSLVVFSATMFALFSGLTDGSAAIVIVQAGLFADASRQLIKVAAQLELDFNSVERVVEYLDLPQEAPAIIEKNRPPAYWPSTSGELVVENLVVQYAPKLPAVLHNISFVVRPYEKIGVVGRTGSGKSTLAMTLLRIVEPTGGRVILDGIDISTLGLEDLRARFTIVSQDVSIFSGTIRSNLDPFGKCTDEECMQALERCHLIPLLKKPNEEVPTVLDIEITRDSLSAGEKQLLALARATLRHTSVIIMDEATSQIDSNLDDQIQRTIREGLSGEIVITIAHRLITVMDYDRVLVLEEGRIVEFDTPRALLSITRGVFYRMCRKSADWPRFMEMAETGIGR